MSIRHDQYHAPKLIIHAARGFPADVVRKLRERVVSFVIEDKATGRDKATIELDNSDGALVRLDSLGLGCLLLISIGYRDKLGPPRAYVVRELSGAVRAGGLGEASVQDRRITKAGGILKLECHSLVYMFNFARGWFERDSREFPRVFYNSTIPQAIVEIARRAGFPDHAIYVESMDIEHVFDRLVIPTGLSIAEWINFHATARGWTFAIDHEGFHFHSPRRPDASTDDLTWFWGDPDVISWNLMKTLRIPGRVKATGIHKKVTQFLERSPSDDVVPGTVGLIRERNKGALAEARSGKIDLGRSVATDPTSIRAQDFWYGWSAITVLSNPERQRPEIKESLLVSQMHRKGIRMRLVGNPHVWARRRVVLRNFGRLIDGEWYVSKARHSYQAGQVYITEVDLIGRKDKKGRIKVTQNIERSPDGSYMVGHTFALLRRTYRKQRGREQPRTVSADSPKPLREEVER